MSIKRFDIRASAKYSWVANCQKLSIFYCCTHYTIIIAAKKFSRKKNPFSLSNIPAKLPRPERPRKKTISGGGLCLRESFYLRRSWQIMERKTFFFFFFFFSFSHVFGVWKGKTLFQKGCEKEKLCFKRGVKRKNFASKGVWKGKNCVHHGALICQKCYISRRRSVKGSLSCFHSSRDIPLVKNLKKSCLRRRRFCFPALHLVPTATAEKSLILTNQISSIGFGGLSLIHA